MISATILSLKFLDVISTVSRFFFASITDCRISCSPKFNSKFSCIDFNIFSSPSISFIAIHLYNFFDILFSSTSMSVAIFLFSEYSFFNESVSSAPTIFSRFSSISCSYLTVLVCGFISPSHTLYIVFFKFSNVCLSLATVPTTGTPNRFSNFFKSIFIFFFFASSNKFTQTIMLSFISII